MVHGAALFFALFNNLAIFVALVAVYGFCLARFKHLNLYNLQIVWGLLFGLFSIGCMYAKIPVFQGVIVDQRNAIITLSGLYGGPLSAVISAIITGSFRLYIGGDGATAGVVGVGLATLAGIGLKKFVRQFKSIQMFGIGALVATIIILPGFLFVGDIRTGWTLTKAMAFPYGSAIFLGIFWGGLLLHREEEKISIESLLLESEEKYRELITGTQDLVTQTDKNGKLTFVNPIAEKIFGYSTMECVGKSAFQFIHPEDLDRTMDWFNECVTKKVYQSTIENRQINLTTGDSHFVIWSSTFHYDESGELIEVSGIAHDFTARKQAETFIRESEARYRTLFERVPDGIFIANPESYHLDANPMMCEMLGYARTELIGLHVTDIVMQKENENNRSESDQFKSEDNYPRVWQFQRKDGSFLHAEVKVIPMPDGNLLGTVRDITQRRKIEAQLQQAQKMEAIGRLAGGIAHDLNNMLSPILGYSELLLIDASDPITCKKWLEQIKEAGLKARGLVHQLLAFSRKQTLEYKPINLNSTVHDFKELLRRTIREDIDLEIMTTPKIGTIRADIGQIEQVIMNLCVNAQDAMPDGGKLILETALVELDSKYTKDHPSSRAGQYVMLAVTDTGIGMDESIQKQVFDPFFSTKGDLGTGLGLSTVYGIVKQHDGTIWIYSEPGKGTTIKVYLPKTDEQPMEIGSNEIGIEKLKGSETILIVEDSESVRNLSCDILERQGYRVLSASSGAEALNILVSYDGAIDLLLTDVVMTDMNGKELYEEVKKKSAQTNVLYMSGYTNNVIAHHGILDEGIKLIQKPFSIQGLASKVFEALGRK